MPKRYQATSTNVEDYWQLFVNRRAYVLQSMRPHAESGRYYYFRPKAGKNGEVPSLTAATVRRHLEGDLTIGVYAMSPATQRCKWIAMDGDYKDSLKHLCELQWELQQQKVDAALEQSRRGAHLWIFGEQPLLARQCRLLISGLAQKLGIPVKGAGTAEGIEIFPKHDELKDGDFGNAIRGPLGIHRTISARFWFYGADYNLDNQLAFLKRVTKLSEEQLGALLQKLGQPSEGEKKEIKPTPRWQYPEGSWVLKVDSQGKVDIRDTKWRIGRALAGEWVQVLEVETRLQVYYCNTLMRELEPANHRSTIIQRWIPTEE